MKVENTMIKKSCGHKTGFIEQLFISIFSFFVYVLIVATLELPKPGGLQQCADQYQLPTIAHLHRPITSTCFIMLHLRYII